MDRLPPSVFFFLPVSALLSQIHLEAARSSLVMFLIAFGLAVFTIPIFARDFTNDCPAKPLHNTSIRPYLIFHDFCQQCSINSLYFDLFLSFSKARCSFHGEESFQIIHIFVLTECSTRSGRSVISAICLENFN